MPPRRARWLLLAWLAMIFVASSIPGASMPSAEIFRFDKAIHFGVYAVLGALAQQSFGRWWLAWLIATAWGLSDELHQWFVPGRFVEVLDLVADTTGGLLGALAVRMWVKLRARGARSA